MESKSLAARTADTPPLQLGDFVPFRLNRLAAEVSEHLATVYRERSGMARHGHGGSGARLHGTVHRS
jgi:hypothetical protein